MYLEAAGLSALYNCDIHEPVVENSTQLVSFMYICVPAPAPKSTSTGLPSNVAAAIACIPLIGGIIFYILEKHDSFVRFYAMQSIIFGGAWILFAVVYSVAHMILTPIPAIGLFFAIVLWVIWHWPALQSFVRSSWPSLQRFQRFAGKFPTSVRWRGSLWKDRRGHEHVGAGSVT